ncbi:SRPBCC family protein [Trinickia violacea]|uniref:SRPBCC family protein n=1 Tax=Trinickia violacea TaxID=2571746 RepID=A0A4P8J4R1_9BURK|nr:SRPBCC family protein [Trinickia violacea]QCP55094.1 SRPBCC family protein [Trinickia violacea]
MSIHFEHSILVPQSPDDVFATLDDFSATPKWLERCTGIEKLEPGPNSEGQALRYSYLEHGRAGVMEGRISVREPGRRLSMIYVDKMMQVTVDFRMALHNDGTELTHAVTIEPKTFFARLFSPMLRRQLPKQTVGAMEKLRGYLASISMKA